MNIPFPKNHLMSRGMTALLLAQFLSAMADNVLFVAAIAMLKAASGGDSLLPWCRSLLYSRLSCSPPTWARSQTHGQKLA